MTCLLIFAHVLFINDKHEALYSKGNISNTNW